MSARTRWVCPRCDSVVLGPQRPRADHTCRVCLACSAGETHLVKRFPPTLERKRAVRRQDLADRRAVIAAREEARASARFTVDDVDLLVLRDRLCRLEAFGGPRGGMTRHPPKLKVRRCSRAPLRFGFAKPGQNLVSISTWPKQRWTTAVDTLIHELAHVYVDRYHPKRAERVPMHGDRFRHVLRDAVREAWDLVVPTDTICGHGITEALNRLDADTPGGARSIVR